MIYYRIKKKEAINKRLGQINGQYSKYLVREMYEKVRWEQKGFQPRLYNVRSNTGKMFFEEKEIIDRWRIYFENNEFCSMKEGRTGWSRQYQY